MHLAFIADQTALDYTCLDPCSAAAEARTSNNGQKPKSKALFQMLAVIE